jgi:hydroxymethylpyrimidine pyrophosphatase-like HAD family hydrolase
MFKSIIKTFILAVLSVSLIILMFVSFGYYKNKQSHGLIKKESTERLINFLDQYLENNLDSFKSDKLYRIPTNDYKRYEIKFVETKKNGESVYVWSSLHEVTLFKEKKEKYEVKQTLLLASQSLSEEDLKEYSWEMTWDFKKE